MLSELWVNNLAVAEHLEVRLGPGLIALTGETGAGKSLVVGALDLVLGARASSNLLRRGAKEAEVIARFELAPDHFAQRGLDLPLEDGVLVLKRVIGRDGRSRAYVNDRPATVGRLRELGAALADLHGQHEQQNLLREETHLHYLDAFGEALPLLRSVEEAHRETAAAAAELEAFEEARRRSGEEREFLRFQLEELERAELQEGEEEALLAERERVSHGERLVEAAEAALDALAEGESNAVSLLHRASLQLGKGAAHDARLERLRNQVDESLVTAEEAAREITAYAASLEPNPARLEELETRLDLLSRLRRKYHRTVEALLERREELRTLVGEEEAGEERRQGLQDAVEQARGRLDEAARGLSAARSRAAARFGRQVSRELEGLGLAQARFRVALRPPRQGIEIPGRAGPVGPRGAEEAVFLLAPNPGEEEGPLERIASGGEVSRVMLALKNTLRTIDPVPLVIFDEIDAGIGGVVAEAVGIRLASIAARRQVLVVTHLAVIAGRADRHLLLRKRSGGGRTRVEIESLEGEAREEELARMLAGRGGGEAARRTARTILAEGGRP